MFEEGIGIGHAVGEVDELIIFELVFEAQGEQSIPLVLLLSIRALLRWYKLHILPSLLPFLRGRGIQVNPHSRLIQQLAPGEVEEIEFNPLLWFEIADSEVEPASMAFGIAVYPHK